MELDTEDDELDFVLGILPTKYRPVTLEDKLSDFNERHIKWHKLKKGETAELPEAFTRKDDKNVVYVAEKVPTSYDGFRTGDTTVMMLGGSGDMLAYALARQAEKIGAYVSRISAFNLKKMRNNASKDEDATLLA